MSAPRFLATAKGTSVYVTLVVDGLCNAEMVSSEEARARGMKLLDAADIAEGRPLFRPTLRCSKCLPTGTCSCPSEGRA